MRVLPYLILTLFLLMISLPSFADESPNVLGSLKHSSTADSLQVDFDIFINDQVDSLALDLWDPVRIFAARDPLASASAETLRIRSPFSPGNTGLFTHHLKGRLSFPRNGRGDPSRIWVEYWGGETTDSKRPSKRKFWELKELSVGFTLQPLIITGSSFHYFDPGMEGLSKQSSYRESAFAGLHVNYDRWRLTLAEGGAAGHFWGEADSTQQTSEFTTGVVSNLRYDLGDLEGFRPIVGAGWHMYGFQMRGPATQESLPEIDLKEEGLGLTLGVADPAGALTYTFLDMDHFRHRVVLDLPVLSFKRTIVGTRLDYVQVDGRPAWKTHFLIDFSTPLSPKDGPLTPTQTATWTWRNYAALAVAGVAEPIVAVGVVAYLVVKGIGSVF
jgi:hypothetical protein